MGSNALNALLGKAFSERSEDFSAAQRRESIGIFVVWVGRPGGPVCRPYENTKTSPVNAVGADDLGGPRAHTVRPYREKKEARRECFLGEGIPPPLRGTPF